MKPQPTFNLSVTINGNPWSGEVPVEETLLEFVRLRLRLTGTKRSCESEVCGACTVLVDGRPVSSCNYLAFEAHGRSVLTIEGVHRAMTWIRCKRRSFATSVPSVAIVRRDKSWRPKHCSWKILGPPGTKSPNG